MFFNWTLEEKDFAVVDKISRRGAKVYSLYNMLGNILIAPALILMLFVAAVMYFGGLYARAFLLAVTGCLLIYLIYLFNKSFRPKKTCKYIKDSHNHLGPEYSLSLNNDGIIYNNTPYALKEISAVFLLKGYAVFTLKDKTYFILKPGETEHELHSWLENGNLSVYSWCSTATAKSAAKNTRKRYVKKIRPVMVIAVAFFIVFCAISNLNKHNTDNMASENAQVFTFDMSQNIYGQLVELYEYYEATHNFESTNDIYYSYVTQSANLLNKTSYIDGNAAEAKELLFTGDDGFCYIKLYKPENSQYRIIEITNDTETISIRENENGYADIKSRTGHSCTAKDMYRLLTEYDYICQEYPVHKSAWYQYGSANIKLKADRLFGEDVIIYRMAQHDITVYNKSKDKQFEIYLQNIPQNDIDSFIGMFTAISAQDSCSDIMFTQLVTEIEDISAY